MKNSFIELTYIITGEPTLVNVSQITSSYRMLEKRTNKMATKINFLGGSYTIVEEAQNIIHSKTNHLLRFNYSPNGKSVLVNPNNVVYCHTILDDVTDMEVLKLTFSDGQYQIIDTDIDTFSTFVEDYEKGFIQPSDWVDFELPVPQEKKVTKVGLKRAILNKI